MLYEYIRGSHLYGLNNEYSDVDTGGVFICTEEELLGCFGYKPQVSDSRQDNTWYEVGELVRLLLKSNPTMLECLFVPKEKILSSVHPLMQMILDQREQFISKQCFNPFFGYARQQIEKARGFNKKIVNPVTERLTPFDFIYTFKGLTPFDFIYTFKGQGSTKFRDWLANRSLHQECCGLVNVPNMQDIYGVYYDFGAHVSAYKDWKDDMPFLMFSCEYFADGNLEETNVQLAAMMPLGYRGVINAEADGNELRLSSIEDKDDRPVCFVSYNQSGYSSHCRKYAEYQDWVRNRNPIRYESNLDKNYDSKNMMHCFRLMHTAAEIAEGKGMILERTWDRQFLLDVRNHKFEYEEIVEKLEEDKERMNRLMEQSTIREKIDVGLVNDLMIEIRKRQLALG